MKEKGIIRVVKRDQRKEETAVTDTAKVQQSQQSIDTKAVATVTTVTTSDLVATVSAWVREFQKARRTDARNEFKTLFMNRELNIS
ncbi:MAG: hypothetical protein ACRD63_08980 [Pyrinomonadaceae bacterium]